MLNYILPIAVAFLASFQLAKDWGAHQATWRRVVVLILIIFVGIGGAVNNYYSSRKSVWQHNEDQRQIVALKQAVDTTNENQENNTKQFVDAFGKLSQKLSQLETQVQTEKLQKELATVQEEVRNMQTGGDSFAYITFTPENANVNFGGFPRASSGPQFLVAITSHGKYPLRETHCTLMDDERRNEAAVEYNKHPNGNVWSAITSVDIPYYIPYLRSQSQEAPTGEVKMLGMYPFGSKDANDLTVTCSSLNGYWNERLHLRRINGQWHQALSVMGPTVKQSAHPFIYFDPEFPDGKLIAENDWKPIRKVQAK